MFSFHWIKSLLAYFGFKKNARLLVIGPENAGKSTLVSMLRTGKFVQHTHSTWPYVEEIDIDLIRFTAYIMSGHPLLRKLWSDYCSKIEGILFMMDCADSEIFEAVKEELGSTIRADLNPGVPIAILFNKTDKKEAVGEEYLSEKLNLGEHRTGKKLTPKAELPSRPIETFPCSILKQTGYDEAMKWLVYYVE